MSMLSGATNVLRRTFGRVRMRLMSREAVFTRIYKQNLWRDGESRSGPGSTLEATAIIRGELRAILDRLQAKSLLDIPCGDFNWMKEVDLSGIRYTGADIVDELVNDLQRRYGAPGRSFVKLDLARGQLPASDVVLCRDCLFHFSFGDIAAAIDNIKKSGANYLLTTTYESADPNVDIVTGSWRRVDLQKHPFRFPPPMDRMRDDSDLSGRKQLALWRVADIPDIAV